MNFFFFLRYFYIPNIQVCDSWKLRTARRGGGRNTFREDPPFAIAADGLSFHVFKARPCPVENTRFLRRPNEETLIVLAADKNKRSDDDGGGGGPRYRHERRPTAEIRFSDIVTVTSRNGARMLIIIIITRFLYDSTMTLHGHNPLLVIRI